MTLTHTDIILRLKKLIGTKTKKDIGRIMDGGDWVTNGYILLKKIHEPQPWKSHRYQGELESEKIEKILAKKPGQNKEVEFDVLTIDYMIDLHFPELIKLTGTMGHTTWVDAKYLTLLATITWGWGRSPKLRFNEILFLQEHGKPMSEIWIMDSDNNKDGTRDLIGVLMPFRSPTE